MLFSSFIFLFLFLPIVLLVNRFLSLKQSNVFLLLASLFFYFTGEGGYTILLIISILWNYFSGRIIYAIRKNNQKSKWVLSLSVAGNLLLLVYYKYFGFFIESFGLQTWLASSNYSSIILPIGISFFTFQGLSYVVDVYRNPKMIEKSPIRLGLFISYFPQLIAGPIVKFNEIHVYLKQRSANLDDIYEGAKKFIRGLAKKVIIADNLARFVDLVMDGNLEGLNTPVAWFALMAYALQIYYDFSGYSDMAIGLCRIMGIKIPENFLHPYSATSIQDFWRRWHVSLSTWFKNYLYIPLGGNRKGISRTYLNLLIVFFLTGLWHGASYNFIVWGLIHGLFLVIERLFPTLFKNLPIPIKRAYTLLVVLLAWAFFRIEQLPEAWYFIQVLSFNTSQLSEAYPLIFVNNYFCFVFIIGAAFTFPIRARFVSLTKSLNISTALSICFHLLLWLYAVIELSQSTYSPFIYFKF